MGVLSLWKFTKLSTWDFCTFLYVHYFKVLKNNVDLKWIDFQIFLQQYLGLSENCRFGSAMMPTMCKPPHGKGRRIPLYREKGIWEGCCKQRVHWRNWECETLLWLFIGWALARKEKEVFFSEPLGSASLTELLIQDSQLWFNWGFYLLIFTISTCNQCKTNELVCILSFKFLKSGEYFILMCVLQHISVWICHISNTQPPLVATVLDGAGFN